MTHSENMSSLRSNSSTRSQKSHIPGQAMASNQPMEDRTREVDYMEDKVQLDADLQIQWSNWMSENDASVSSYRRVFVLLLSWHPECDDMAVDSEVKRLGALFQDIYSFDVTSVHIDSRKRMLPQIQANLAVAKFVGENDQEDALFIVYYAGHGSPGKNMGDLNMSGRRKQNKQNIAKEYSHITWNLVESNLKTTRADVFLIFDCCYSDDLGRGAPLNSRSFEYLAASSTDYTPSPGEKSFTSALIWALKELAAPKSSPRDMSPPMFTTSKLAKKVRDAPHFPKEQKPSLTMRDPDAYRHIVLAPLPNEGYSTEQSSIPEHSDARGHVTEDSDDEEDPHKGQPPQFLSLTFHFKCEQETENLQKLAHNLRQFMKYHNTELHQVQWSGIWGGSGRTRPPARHRFREAVGKVLRKRILSEGLSKYPSYNGTNRTSTESTPLLSESSSVTTSAKLKSQSPRLFYRLFAFFRNFQITTPKARNPLKGAGSDGRESKHWRSRFVDYFRLKFRHHRV